MTTSIEHHLRQLAPDGLRLHIWPRTGGGYQINVAEPGTSGWTVLHDDDVVRGVGEALRQRACGISSRVVEARDEWSQVELEEWLAVTTVDDFEELM